VQEHPLLTQLKTALNNIPSALLQQQLTKHAFELGINVQILPDSTSAGVLIPVITHEQNPTILLTQRTAHLRHHAGQISFPGGTLEKTDPNIQDCVLREVKEEIGITADKIAFIAHLGEWYSYSGFAVSVFVGLIHPPLTLALCPHEVDAVFEVPLAYLLEPNHYQKIQKDTPIVHHYYETHYEGKRIWGFTAGVLALLAAYFQSFETP
jgi:8-oxo-dGTP pyrophosphatase MutT (NUDIX family)